MILWYSTLECDLAVVLPELNLGGCLAVMDRILMLILKARRRTEAARPNPQRGSRARRYPLLLRLSAGVVDAIDCLHELRDLEIQWSWLGCCASVEGVCFYRKREIRCLAARFRSSH